jgi:hypothetical protein
MRTRHIGRSDALVVLGRDEDVSAAGGPAAAVGAVAAVVPTHGGVASRITRAMASADERDTDILPVAQLTTPQRPPLYTADLAPPTSTPPQASPIIIRSVAR